ncbi:uncharacterized protein LOC109862354 [Pseudomyrmex gracilis]|uniref:uncharacterized protein LOC109862354 n=1 Tax=Pseudomyrmex gracilis TaxID=219809 RepID=UPI00099565EF|nr:uncharacterized protein LOC109862354 [Pseudomyrmex gracilis]
MIVNLKNNKRPVIKELRPFVSEHILNLICETAMDVSLNNSTGSKTYRHAFEQMSDILMHRVTRPWLYKEWINALFPTGRQQKSSEDLTWFHRKNYCGEETLS